MAKKHDESGALKSFARVGRIDAARKVLTLPEGANAGIKTWGKIDYLTNHCGWTLVNLNLMKAKAQNAPRQQKER